MINVDKHQGPLCTSKIAFLLFCDYKVNKL